MKMRKEMKMRTERAKKSVYKSCQNDDNDWDDGGRKKMIEIIIIMLIILLSIYHQQSASDEFLPEFEFHETKSFIMCNCLSLLL